MSEPKPVASTAMKPFVGGLILGLLIGGLAGAYLGGIMEGSRIPTVRPSATKPGTPTAPRDERPDTPDTAPTGAVPTPATSEPK